MQTIQTPEAIEAITREEQTWRAYGFDLSERLVLEVGRHASDDYYLRQTAVPNDLTLMEKQLNKIDPQELDPDTARDMRHEFDLQMQYRPVVQEATLELWHAGKLRKDVRGSLEARFAVEHRHPEETLFKVARDGALSLEIHNPAHVRESDPKDKTPKWRRYVMPRGVSYVYHDKYFEGEGKHRLSFIRSTDILNIMFYRISELVELDPIDY